MVVRVALVRGRPARGHRIAKRRPPTSIAGPTAGSTARPPCAASAAGSARWTAEFHPAPPSTTSRGRYARITAGAAPSWSASAWVRNSASRRLTCACRGASGSGRRAGRCRPALTVAPSWISVASPWPTSRNETTSSPGCSGAARRAAQRDRHECASAGAIAPATARREPRAGRGRVPRRAPELVPPRRGRRHRRHARAAATEHRHPRRGDHGRRRRGARPPRAARPRHVRDRLDVDEQRRGQRRERQRERRGDLARHAGENAEPHHGRDRGRREQVGGQRRERDLLEVQRHQRRGADRRGDGDRERVGQRRPACRRANASLSGFGADEQRDHRGERQLPARLARPLAD